MGRYIFVIENQRKKSCYIKSIYFLFNLYIVKYSLCVIFFTGKIVKEQNPKKHTIINFMHIIKANCTKNNAKISKKKWSYLVESAISPCFEKRKMSNNYK